MLFRSTSVTLTGDMTGVTKNTVMEIKTIGNGLQSLELSGFDKIKDETFAEVVMTCPGLETLVLRFLFTLTTSQIRVSNPHYLNRKSSKVAGRTIDAIAATCHSLRVINLNYTNVPASSLGSLLLSCLEVEVFKIAGIPNFVRILYYVIIQSFCLTWVTRRIMLWESYYITRFLKPPKQSPI